MTQLGGRAGEREGDKLVCSSHSSVQAAVRPSIYSSSQRGRRAGGLAGFGSPVKWPKCCPLLTVVKLGLLACQAEANCQLQSGQTSTTSEQQQQQLSWHIHTDTHTHTHSVVCCGIVLFLFLLFLGFGFIVRMNGPRPAPCPPASLPATRFPLFRLLAPLAPA